MANLLNWIGGGIDKIVPGDQSFLHPQDKKKQQQQPQPAPQPQPSFSQKVANFLGGIPNVHLDGLTQLRDELNGTRYDNANLRAAGQPMGPENPVTIGDVAHRTPILKQAIDFANQQATNPPKSLLEGEGQLLAGSVKTGAHYAPYVVPELDIMKAGEGANIATQLAAKGVNNFVPAAGATALDRVAEGERNPVQIAKESAIAGGVNAAASELPVLRGIIKGPERAAVPTRINPEDLPIPAMPKPAAVTELPTVRPVEPPMVQVSAPRPGPVSDLPAPVRVEPPVGAPVKERGLTRNIKANENFSPELQAQVEGGYTPFTDKTALAGTEDFLKQGFDNAHKTALTHLADPAAQIGKQEVSNYGRVLQELDGAGRTEEANAIHDLLSRKLTEAGQTGQAASLLYKRTPEGLRNIAFRDMRNAGVEITPKIQAEIEAQIQAIKGMEDGPLKDFAIATLQKSVAKHIPGNLVDNATSVWKAGLLSGVKTQGGNFVSNSTFGALKKGSDPLATAADKAMSLLTGERTKTLTGKGLVSGTGEGLKGAKTTMKTGIDMRNVGDKYEQHAEINFGNKFMQKVFGNPANYVFRGMSAADQPFYYSALKNSLYDQAKADGINAGLKGSALKQHMEELVANPTEKMALTAEKEANKSVLGYDTFASKFVSGAHKGIDNLPGTSKAGKAVAHAFLNVLVPFVRVPSAFLSRTVDFTPLGVGKEVFSQIAKKQFDQRALSQAIGEGATGAGIIGLGISLTHSNMLSGDYPKSDQKEQERWKAEGITPNSIKLGDKWISLNYMGPLGLLFNAGHKIADAQKSGEAAPGQVAAALGGLGQGLMGQSFVQGFSGFSDAIKDPERNAAAFVRSEIGSLIPSWSNDIANATDQMQRQTNSATDAAKARIPGLRGTLMEKKDAFGNPLEQASGSGVNTAINPLKPSQTIDNPLLSELNRLKDTGKDNFVFPTPDKTLSVGNETVKMSPEQRDKFNTTVGQQTQDAWGKIISSPTYAQLDDTQKANALRTAASDIQSVAKQSMVAELGRGDLADKVKLTAQQQDLAANGVTPDIYTAKALGKLTPQQEYKQKLADYEAKKKAGKLSAIEDFDAQQALGKLAITSKYSQDVVDLYNMSKAKRTAVLAAHPELGGLMDQVSGLSAELKGHSFTSSDKIASAKKGRKGRSGRSKALKLPAGYAKGNSLVRSSLVKASKTKPKIAKAKKSKAPALPKTRTTLA